MIASTVEVRECDPRDPDAGFCLQTYYAELAVRFHEGYDPAVSPVADDRNDASRRTATGRLACTKNPWDAVR